MRTIRIIAVSLSTAALLLCSGCNNPCVELAEQICDRASTDFSACEGVPSGDAKACERMEAVALSCRTLTTSAEEASAADREACKADLELVRALERQQQ